MRHQWIVAVLSIATTIGSVYGAEQRGAGEQTGSRTAESPPATSQDAKTQAGLPPGIASLPGGRGPRQAQFTAGQPAPEQWRGVAEAGVGTVVNLRPDAELKERDERAEVSAAGLHYVQIPVAGADDITPENADRLWTLLQQAPAPVLVHCASGNRVGALLALGAARAGMPSEQAITRVSLSTVASRYAACRTRCSASGRIASR